jgi:hypothetical protein
MMKERSIAVSLNCLVFLSSLEMEFLILEKRLLMLLSEMLLKVKILVPRGL